jgi:hypothetical protein
MARWEHLTEVPEPLKTTMSTEFIRWEKQDLGIETIIEGMFNAGCVTKAVCRTVNSATNPIRLPELCRIVKAAHPTESIRNIFIAIALFTGLSESYVRDLYYRRPQ